jgi:predicted outer membrane repeat protein
MSKNNNHRPRRARLGLEALEDRLAPAVINVLSLSDGTGTVTQTAPGVFSASTLRAAISQANKDTTSDTINLTVAGTYKITLAGTTNETDNAAGELAYTGSHDLTIQNASSGAVVVDGGGLNRVFDVNPAAQNTTPFTVTFQGLTIQNGVTSPGDADQGSGGGIRAQGAASVVLANVILQHNTATADGGGIALESIGNVGIGTLTISNSVVANNHAGDAGGGVETDGNGLVTITNSTISDNSCVNQGAGVWLDAGAANLNMTDDVVSGNVAEFMLAGGIGNAGTGSVTLVGCTIENNSTGSSLQTINGVPTLVPGTGAGFADAVNVGNLTVTNCIFLNNTAAGNGGAIQEGGPNTTITGTVFEGNTSGGNGGALFVDGVTVLVSNSVFRQNVAVNGGAVESDANVFTASNCTFDTNRAMGSNGGMENNAGPGGSGGAIEIQANNNTPNDLVTNSLFLNNSANNATTGNGGAIELLAGALEVANSQFTGNVTGGNGGAIDAGGTATTLFVFASTLNNNRALGGSGGAISIATATPTVELSTLVGNSAGVNGGAIFDSGQALSVLSDTINGNSTGNVGGGVSVFNGGSLTIGDSIVSGNSTAFGAPDVFSLTITDKGGNLIGVAPPGFGAGTLTGVNPKLGPLQNNGGVLAGASSQQFVVQTEALLPGSPAIGAGVNGIAEVKLDERCFPGPSQGRTNVSIGAYEPQYAANASANSVFVENLYEVLLNRPGDAGGLAGFTNLLNQGVSKVAIVQAFESSLEYRIDQVQLLYQHYLHRAADPGGLLGFVNFLGSGGTLEQVAAIMVGSDEYADLHGGNNSTAFLDAVYEDVLNRAPDAPGLTGFSGALAAGMSRTQTASLFFSSPEYFNNLVQYDYQTVLGRTADPAGLNGFVAGLQSGGLTDQTALAFILGSTESFANRG